MPDPRQQLAEQGLMQGMQVSPQEIDRRKEFLKFGEEDMRRLQGVNDLAQRYADSVIDDLYKHFLSFEETRSFFEDPKVLEHVKRAQKAYFLGLTGGEYGPSYIEHRLNVGAVHERIGLVVKWYLGAYSFYLRAVAEKLFEAFPKDPQKALAAFQSLMKLVFLDIGLATDTYIFQREQTIRVQQEAIRELSTPVLQLRERLLILPIVGVIDSQRARQLTEQLLRAIRANRAKVVVVDITGVPTVDSKVANHLIQTVEASRLMGATVIVSGLSSEVAQALVTIGVDLSRINTVGDLQGGIEEAERLLGYRLVAATDAAARNEHP